MLLSICIPTHDGRGWTLREAIDSVLPQIVGKLEGKVQICVSDNGSQDGTNELLEQYLREYPHYLKVYRFPQDVGGRLNILNAAKMADGDTLWLLGSDDALEQNAVETALSYLSSHPSAAGFCINRTRFEKTLTTEITDYPYHLPDNDESFHIYTDSDTIFTELGVWQNYISGVLIKKSLWQDIVRIDGVEKITSYRHFTHSYVIARVMMLNPIWGWIPDRLVKYRSHNNAYLDTPTRIWRFNAEAIDDMNRQFRDVAGNWSRGYHACMKRMFHLWWSPNQLIQWKLAPEFTTWDDRHLLSAFIKSSWFIPQFWGRPFLMLLIPHQIYVLRYRLGLGSIVRRMRSALSFKK